MNPFYKTLEKLRTDEEQVLLQQPEVSDPFPCSTTFGLVPLEQDGDEDQPNSDNTRHLSAESESENKEATLMEASSTDESNHECTSVPSVANQSLEQQEVVGAGSLNIRLIDQYPCYGVSDKGDLTVIGDSLIVSDRKTSPAKAEVRSGSFLEESDFSLVTEENIPERVSKSVSTVPKTGPDTNLGGIVQDSEANRNITQPEKIPKSARTAETTIGSLHQPREPPAVEPQKATIIPNRNACVTPRMPPLAEGIALQPHQIPQYDPFFSELFTQLANTPKAPTDSRGFQQNLSAMTPSVRTRHSRNVKTGMRFPQTPPTTASSSLPRFSRSSAHSHNPMICAPIRFPQLLKGIDSCGNFTEKKGPSEKTMLAQNVRNLPIAPLKRHPTFTSDAAGPTITTPNVTPTSLLDAQVPFQFKDPNLNPENRGNAVISETLPGVTLDRNQIMENEGLIRRARNLVGKRPISTPEHSFVTPAKRIRSVYNGSKTTGMQPIGDVNTMLSDIQMSPITVPTQPVLERLGTSLTRHAAVQNLHPQASFSPLTIPSNVSSPHNAAQMYSRDHNYTNVRSEDVDLPKRHHCKACLAVYAFKENCDRHYKVVHLKRQVFRCPHCTSSYLQPKTMRSHIDKKHCTRSDEVSILPCYWCPAKFGTNEEWELHAAQAHPEQRSKFRGKSP